MRDTILGYFKERTMLSLGKDYDVCYNPELAGVPLYIGEWNNVERVPIGDVRTIDPEGSDITQQDIDLFLATFDRLGVWGLAFWIRNFMPNPTPNFNLIAVSDEGQIVSTKYYEVLKNGIAKASILPQGTNQPILPQGR